MSADEKLNFIKKYMKEKLYFAKQSDNQEDLVIHFEFLLDILES